MNPLSSSELAKCVYECFCFCLLLFWFRLCLLFRHMNLLSSGELINYVCLRVCLFLFVVVLFLFVSVVSSYESISPGVLAVNPSFTGDVNYYLE